MCGLFGGASYGLSQLELERISQLGVISQLRGTDSTGILSCYRQAGKIGSRIIKEVVDSSAFIYGREYVDHLKDKKPFIIAGHCRSATLGNVNYSNAHPYNVGKIVGMKNGTVPNVPGRKDDETDSKALLRVLQDEGLIAAAKVADKGGCALVWVDYRDLTLNFYRNIGRPLWFMKTSGTLYWASEFYMLVLVRDRTGIAYDQGQIEALPVEVHRKFSMTQGFMEPTDTKIFVRGFYTPTPEQKEKEFSTPLPDTAKTCAHTPPTTSVPITKIKMHDIKPAGKYTLCKIMGFKGFKMTPGKAASILFKGCAHCNASVKFDDIESIKMFSKKEWLCDKCSGDPFAIMQVGAHNRQLYQCKIIVGETNGSC